MSPLGEEAVAPRYSVLIASRNEGEALRRTVDDVLRQADGVALELIVIDDASEDRSADFLSAAAYGERGVRLARNDRHRGLAFSRARAADLARGSFLVFLDAHCAVSSGWLAGLEAQLAGVGGRGIAVPLIYGLDGATWAIDLHSGRCAGSTIVDPFLEFFWTEPQLLEGRLATATIGGGAWMVGREWYDHLGGLDRGMVGWGGENLDISLRTWAAGGWCVVAEGVRVGHRFQERKPGPNTAVEITFNKIRCAHNAFTQPTFHQVMLRLRCLEGFREALRLARGDSEGLGRLKAHAESIRKRSDRWILDTFRLPLLEPPFFYRSPRKQPAKVERRRRPEVSLVVTCRNPGADLEPLLASILETTSYGNYELVVAGTGSEPALEAFEKGIYRGHPRLKVLRLSTPFRGGMADNLWAFAGTAEYCAFLDDRCRMVEEHWLEKFILLFEKHARLFLASPRLRRIDAAGASPEPGPREVFDAVWSWDSPGFSRARSGVPPAEVPYQALSCPDAALVVHRERFVEVGGFDQTVPGAGRPVLDLAIRGWLSGYEVYCHPGVTLGRLPPMPGRADPNGAAEPLAWWHYAQVLAAAKGFTNPARAEECSRRSPLAQPLLQTHRLHLQARRRDLLARARYDDDWLFYKFAVPSPPGPPQADWRVER